MHLDNRKRLLLGDFARSETYIVDLQPDGTIIATPGEVTPIAAMLPAKRAARRRPTKKAAPAAAENPQDS